MRASHTHLQQEMCQTLAAVLTELANHGVAVFAQEAHGHGTSEPTDERNRCLVWDFKHLVSQSTV